jgi:DnaJ-domain-containing protein 1
LKQRLETESRTESDEWEKIEQRRRRIYEELWRSDEERVKKQRERDPLNNRRRKPEDRQNPFEIPKPTLIPRATQLLGVRVGASAEEVKLAYKKLAMKWHPDRPGGSAEKMKEINEAKEILLKLA